MYITNNKKTRNIKLIIIILYLILIFLISNMPGKTSTERSKKIVNNILDKTNIVNKNELSKEKQNDLYSKFGEIHYIFRKCAHGFEYLVLAILILEFLNCYNISILYKIPITISLSSVYSLTDEFHQMFIPNRTASFTDCLIDTTGAIIGIIIFILFTIILEKIKHKRST